MLLRNPFSKAAEKGRLLAAKFAPYAGVTAGLTYLAADINLALRHHYTQQAARPLEQASAALLVPYDLCVMLSDKYPAMKKIAGVAMTASGAALAMGGVGQPGQNMQIISGTLLSVAGVALTAENALQAKAKTIKKDDASLLDKILVAPVEYPVAFSGALQIGVSAYLAIAAFKNKDVGMLSTAVAWVASSAMLILCDENIKRNLRAASQIPPAP